MTTIYAVDFTDASVDPVNKKQFIINPGAWDTTTSLVIPGQGAALYGEHMAENLIHMLENFASEEPPMNPTVGQLWYHPSIDALKILIRIDTAGDVKTYDWRVVGGISNSPTEPADRNSLWYDISNPDPAEWQLKIFNTGLQKWISVADRYVRKAGDVITGSIVSGFQNVGLTSKPSTANAFVGGFFPGTGNTNVRILAGNGTAVVLNGSKSNTLNDKNFTVTTDAADETVGLFNVSSSGKVSITKGVLDMNDHRINGVTAGVAALDAVNVTQLTDQNTRLTKLITDLQNNKVDRAGDTMTGGLRIIGTSTVTGVGEFPLYLKGAAGNHGVCVELADATNLMNGINIVNKFGTGNTYQSVFNVKSYTGDTTISGAVTIYKTLYVAGSALLNTISTMNVPITAITAARHLVTKEYVDVQIDSLRPKDRYARVNPADPLFGDILVSGSNMYLYNGGWKQVFPAQWAD